MTSWELSIEGFADPGVGLLVAAMQDGTREWLHNLEEVPEGFARWRAYPGGMCAGALMLHMAACERWWIERSVLGAEDVDRTDVAVAYDLSMDQYEGLVPDPPDEGWDWYMDVFRRHRAKSVEQLRGVSDGRAFLGSTAEEEFSVEWVVGHLVQHDSYHGGQIVMLATMMGAMSGV